MVKQKTRKRSAKKVRDEVLSIVAPVPTSRLERPLTEITRSPVSMEDVLQRRNMQQALKRVIANKGSPGSDGMQVTELPEFLMEHWPTIRASLMEGRYRPGQVRRAYIPKKDGSKRSLGIPRVLDRLIQQAVAQVLGVHYDRGFSESSFGFRPGKSGHQAIERAQEYVRSGREIVVDIDLEKFFDKVNHDRLMSRLSEQVKDGALLKLISGFLKAGVLEDGLTKIPSAGTPQGGPLSPLLSNIVLDELDKELEERGHCFVRYADDLMIFVKSQRAGDRVMENVTELLESRLNLKVNREKSLARPVNERSFLSFSFSKGEDRKIVVSPEAIRRFKVRIRELTRQGRSIARTVYVLSEYMRGWVGYFGKAETPTIFKEFDSWVRRRIRRLYLKMWRKPRTRYVNFRKLGMPKNDLMFLIRTTKRYWYLSGTSAVNRVLNKKHFRDLGLVSMKEIRERKAS